MSDKPAPTAVTELPTDYPGKTARFAAEVERLIYGIFGVQARSPGAGAALAAELESLFALRDGPMRVEHLRYVDEQGAQCEVYLAYWTDRALRALVCRQRFLQLVASLASARASRLLA